LVERAINVYKFWQGNLTERAHMEMEHFRCKDEGNIRIYVGQKGYNNVIWKGKHIKQAIIEENQCSNITHEIIIQKRMS
jgi:hypothetical protein